MSMLDDNILLGIGKRLRAVREIVKGVRKKIEAVEKNNTDNKAEIDNIKQRVQALENSVVP